MLPGLPCSLLACTLLLTSSHPLDSFFCSTIFCREHILSLERTYSIFLSPFGFFLLLLDNAILSKATRRQGRRVRKRTERVRARERERGGEGAGRWRERERPLVCPWAIWCSTARRFFCQSHQSSCLFCAPPPPTHEQTHLRIHQSRLKLSTPAQAARPWRLLQVPLLALLGTNKEHTGSSLSTRNT